MKRYEEVTFSGLAEQDCSCGVVRRAFADSEDGPASVHLLDLAEEPVCHYHRKTTEIYVILEGEGHLELDGELIAVKPFSAVMIKPGCRHRGIGKLRLFNISVPRFDPEDFFYDDIDLTAAGTKPVH
tara:strand:+ start:5029 stop:5409 length:381 start_codon:yes stop_codon:yes gene_type:complete